MAKKPVTNPTRALALQPESGSVNLMTTEELAHSARHDDSPPAELDAISRALWWARNGQWEAAHDLCQEIPGPFGAWIHAWLHREEGDYGNACYWYARANRPAPAVDASLEHEWFTLAEAREP
ncbi:hypothetical protein HNR46_003217 [Haloferula luteola]|uniref:Tetratricopeptide repeat protein n=1 Tax=Haloferula luteola TaxID=595692 RepID=A0A840V3T9_9BACT|nr:hypothetical protein [Haloferula luteola]MBB5352967.1 hypothetical protein [Haloferula luteola]